jgi:hypothetical protein
MNIRMITTLLVTGLLTSVTAQVSLTGAKPGGYPETCTVPETIANNRHFLYVAPEDGPALVLQTIKRPSQVTLLSSDRELPFEWDGKQVTVEVPVELCSSFGDIVAVEFSEPHFMSRTCSEKEE